MCGDDGISFRQSMKVSNKKQTTLNIRQLKDEHVDTFMPERPNIIFNLCADCFVPLQEDKKN
jgi:hypothetical protein